LTVNVEDTGTGSGHEAKTQKAGGPPPIKVGGPPPIKVGGPPPIKVVVVVVAVVVGKVVIIKIEGRGRGGVG